MKLTLPRAFSVEPAKSSRSTCKACNRKIGKDVLRMGAPTDYPGQTKWFHLKCFTKKMHKGPSTKSDIAGFTNLASGDQKKVLKHVFGETSNDATDSEQSLSSSENDTTSVKKKKNEQKRDKGRKVKKTCDKENEAESAEPTRKRQKLTAHEINSMNVTELKAKCKQFGLKQSGKKQEIQQRLESFVKNEQKKRNQKEQNKTDNAFQAKFNKEREKRERIVEELQNNKVVQLRAMLEKNNVKKCGNKCELVERVADCKLYGTYPKCPECGGGTLRVEYPQEYGHDGQGLWSCKGFMDDDRYHHCHYTSTDSMEREKWTD